MIGTVYKIFRDQARFQFMQTCTIWFSLVLVLAWSGCDKTEVKPGDSRLNIIFSGRYGALPFQALQPYGYGAPRSIKINKLDFYLTGLTLLSPSGNVEWKEAGLVDLTGGNELARTISLNGLKSGDYTGIRFNLGVQPDLNKKLPKDFKSDQALSSTSHYWEAWNSYIFSKIEGVLDTKGDNVYDLGFAVHTGTDTCLEQVNIVKAFTLADNQVFSLHLDVDVEQIFLHNGQYFDLANSPLNHNPSNIAALKFFAGQLAGAIQLKN